MFSSVRAPAFPTAHDVITFGDEVLRTPEVKLRECLTEPHHEVSYVVATATWRV